MISIIIRDGKYVEKICAGKHVKHDGLLSEFSFGDENNVTDRTK